MRPLTAAECVMDTSANSRQELSRTLKDDALWSIFRSIALIPATQLGRVSATYTK